MTINIDSIEYSFNKSLIGKELKDVAKLIKSWNFRESSLGLAAVNTYYNTFKKAKENNVDFSNKDAFDVYREIVKGKDVSVIGHFPFLEKQIKDICNLYIIERNPRKGDYPDSACEYLLPKSDYVFITSSTIVNKTFPRLIELSQGKKVIMVGPSTPITPILFKYGISDLSGFIVENKDGVINTINSGRHREFFKYGNMVSLKNKE
ncbi:DUF364 domain-containing protein [Miniphocaeibacter halophilus]|uniref:DUF364 domain-containing protein n=1 Tax=Miniphocaeibacter halophilus TaxID=2931922 RepID=A0AC61MSG7_9FIRM|nr:DUF364 domain-containing protein [Miniphocaeibacter halophilus]QQK08590.1 DUF364 domain-containing protein [Miniphocaeibacter halophilus]